jgi:hypothetical protein
MNGVTTAIPRSVGDDRRDREWTAREEAQGLLPPSIEPPGTAQHIKEQGI